jgi:hypothetical protein
LELAREAISPRSSGAAAISPGYLGALLSSSGDLVTSSPSARWPEIRLSVSRTASPEVARPLEAARGTSSPSRSRPRRHSPGGHVSALVQLLRGLELVRADRPAARRELAAVSDAGRGQSVAGPLCDQVMLDYVDDRFVTTI